MAGMKRGGSFCCCLCAPFGNKVLPSPSDTDVHHRRVTVDNFFQRGQADGASDVDQPHKLERHVSGYSFSTRTTIGDMESQAGLSELYTSDSDTDDDDDESTDVDNDEMKTVITEGGLSKVAIELDHPLAPYYEGLDDEDVPGMLLSDTRLRTAGFYMPDRSTINRSIESRLSTFTDWEPGVKLREDTPVPGGKRQQRNLIHHLAKHKTCPIVRHGGSGVLGRHVPMTELEAMTERSRADTPSTHRTTARPELSYIEASTARTLPADDIDSLASSNSNLSAIGERSSESTESDSDDESSSHSSRRHKTSVRQQAKQLSTSHNVPKGLLRNALDEGTNIKLGSTFPGLSTNALAKPLGQAEKPKIPPKPTVLKKTVALSYARSEKPPQSADPMSKPRKSPRCLEMLGPAPRTADVFSRHMTDNLRPPSGSRNISNIFRDEAERTYNSGASFVPSLYHPFALQSTDASSPQPHHRDAGQMAWNASRDMSSGGVEAKRDQKPDLRANNNVRHSGVTEGNQQPAVRARSSKARARQDATNDRIERIASAYGGRRTADVTATQRRRRAGSGKEKQVKVDTAVRGGEQVVTEAEKRDIQLAPHSYENPAYLPEHSQTVMSSSKVTVGTRNVRAAADVNTPSGMSRFRAAERNGRPLTAVSSDTPHRPLRKRDADSRSNPKPGHQLNDSGSDGQDESDSGKFTTIIII